MSYCGTTLTYHMSQVTYTDLAFTTQVLFDNYVSGTLIPQAENFVDNYCGKRDGTLRRFNANLGTLRLDGSGKSVLFFPPRFTPLLGLGSLTVDGSAVPNTSLYLRDQFIQWDSGSFREGVQNVYVVGTHGYATVPSDIQYLTAQLCANALLDAKRRAKSDSVQGITGAGGGVQFMTALANPSLLAESWLLSREMCRRLDEYRISWVSLG